MASFEGTRLLFVVNAAWFFVSHRLPLALAAAKAGADVHVAASLDPAVDHNSAQLIADAGITFHPLSLSRSGAGPFELIRVTVALLRLMRHVGPDIVHLVTLKPILLGGFVARLLGVGSVVLAIPGRGSVFSAQGALASVRRWLVLAAYRLAYKRGRTRVVVQNEEDRDYFLLRRLFCSDDVRLIRGAGVDLAHFAVREEPEGAPVIVLASRMLREKGIEYFVAAAAKMKRMGSEARFVLVGQPDLGNPASHTDEELQDWVRTGAVEWWGFRDDMESVFAQCHIVCLPTHYGEGVPKVLIEAAAAGRAIVTTDTAGCRDIVRDGYNGLLVPTRDVDGLVAALAKLIANPLERQAMGKRGRQRVADEFSLEIVVQQTMDVYASLMRTREHLGKGSPQL